MTDIIFENCDLSNINFPYSSLYRVEFINCKLTGCNFNDSTLKSVVSVSYTHLIGSCVACHSGPTVIGIACLNK